MKKVFRFFLLAMLILVSGVSVMAYGAYGHHYLELLSHFRMQYLAAQLICLAGLGLLQSWRSMAFAVVCVLLNLAPVVPYYLPVERTHSAAARPIRILQINVLGPNQHHQEVLNYIHVMDPDVIGAEEVRPHWAEALTRSLKNYPYRIVQPETTAFGIALFSKYPLRHACIAHFGDPYGPQKRLFPSIVADVEIDKLPVTMIVTHPLPPLHGFAVRNSQLADISKHRGDYGQNLILIGDLNSTPWSPYFQQFIRKAGLQDSQLGYGVQASWQSPIPGIMIPIDHVLVSPKFHVLNHVLGPDVGSDHRPVVVDLSFE